MHPGNCRFRGRRQRRGFAEQATGDGNVVQFAEDILQLLQPPDEKLRSPARIQCGEKLACVAQPLDANAQSMASVALQCGSVFAALQCFALQPLQRLTGERFHRRRQHFGSNAAAPRRTLEPAFGPLQRAGNIAGVDCVAGPTH